MKLITVREFLDRHPDVTVLGLAWSCYWRFLVALYGSIFVVAVVLSGLGALFE